MKTYAQILKDFIKANKQRRAVIVKDKGFDTEAQYKEYITTLMKGEIVEPTAPLVKPTIHIVQILDRSGSMSGGKLNNAVAGINSEISELKKDTDVNYTVSIIEFDDTINRKFMLTPIERVINYITRSGGSTALYQAIGETLEALLNSKLGDDKYLIKIFTDGQENCSRGKYSYPVEVAKIIKRAEENGFTVTFVGTANDVASIQRVLSIDESNTLVHDNTARGVQMSFMSSTIATKSYASKVSRGEDVKTEFYSKKVGTL